MSEKLVAILKVFVVILVLIALGMGGWLLYNRFIANGGTDDGGGDEEITLVWWTVWEDEENLQVLAENYMEDNPEVTIQIETQELESQYKNRLKETLGTDEAPDIVRIHNSWTNEFQSNLYPLPATVMSENEYSERFYQTAILDFKLDNGKIYAIPLMFDGLGVYYNKDLLTKAGYSKPAENWEDFVVQAKDLTSYYEDGSIRIAGAGMGTADNIDFSFEIISLLLLQAEAIDQSGNLILEEEEMRAAEAVKYYTDFTIRHNVWDRSLPRDIKLFTEGRLAMMFAPSWRVFDINDALSTAGAELNYDIAPVPQQPTLSGDEVNLSLYWAEAVTAVSDNPEVAWDFLKYVTEQEQLVTFYEKCGEDREFGEIYPVADMGVDLAGQKYVSAYIEMAPTARTWNISNYEKISQDFDALVENVVTSGGSSEGGVHNLLQGILNSSN